MRLAKKVRGIIEASESFTVKFVKTIREEASCFKTSCIYQGEEDYSFSIWSSSESKMVCSCLTFGAKICFATSPSYHCVNREMKRLDRVLVAEFVDGEQFVTEEIIEEGNRWPSIKVRTTWDRKIIRVASSNRGNRSPYIKIEEVRMKDSQWVEGCFKAIEGNAKEHHICGMELAVVVVSYVYRPKESMYMFCKKVLILRGTSSQAYEKLKMMIYESKFLRAESGVNDLEH
ncbi:hypothetical protein Tco_0783050 [Tanacetum coccineum]